MVTCQCMHSCLPPSVYVCECNEKADLHKRPFKRNTPKCQSKTHHSQIGLHEHNDDCVCMLYVSSSFCAHRMHFPYSFRLFSLVPSDMHMHILIQEYQFDWGIFRRVLFHFTSVFCYKINLRRWCVRLTIGSFSCFWPVRRALNLIDFIKSL